jgi:YidC/Oxa1 family membrane protein insertase
MLDESSSDLKLLRSTLNIPASEVTGDGFDMQFYIGPNDFENLIAFQEDLEDIIPFGRSIFGTINRWVIRPMFSALSTVFSNKGLVILLLTLVVKIVLFPLTYRMLYSQAKMGALKPELSRVREKHKDDQQAQQMETMKMYREYGVSPLGGCMPMVLQMPIWFALYRFFPAALEFRQASFLWADDLSSYDVLFYLPVNIPMYGDHVSLLTLLWAGTTLIYTYYNTRHMDFAATNPMMKYMQYLMPIMFLVFFNGYASGLTLYLFYSNLLNILQTVGSRRFLFNESKIRETLNLNKAKPKKKGGFQQRLEKALQEQQKVARNKEQKKKSGGKK